MGKRVITISREFGSGGRTIGRKVAARLGIPCYDSELIEKIAGESKLAEEYIEEQGEHTTHSNWLFNALASGRTREGISVQDYLWSVQRKVILDLAEKESCVIIGRCADYILGENENCLKVFIHADEKKRAERIVKVYGEGKDSPEKRIRDKDKRRKAYYRIYTDMEFGVAQNYHICLDSGVLGIDQCVGVIASLY